MRLGHLGGHGGQDAMLESLIAGIQLLRLKTGHGSVYGCQGSDSTPHIDVVPRLVCGMSEAGR
jgi:hypothetical protein